MNKYIIKISKIPLKFTRVFFEIRRQEIKMDENIINDITSYMDLLRENGLLLTLSCFSEALRPHYQVLFSYEPHLCSVCTYLKSRADTRQKCIENKARLNRKKPLKPYYNCCWAGVEELVIPVDSDGRLVCCISLTGYRGGIEISGKLFEKLSRRLGSEYTLSYGKLSESSPAIWAAERVINPLKYMLVALYKQCISIPADPDPASDIYVRALCLIQDRYMEHISADDIAKAINYSSSHLRHIFLQKSGRTITETLTSVRLSSARNQLAQSNRTVTQIALDCGFCDGNYFSSVFKKHCGVSPKEYRRQIRHRSVTGYYKE